MPGSRPTIEDLLAHERWVVRLARALARDEDAADDIAQEARVALWRRGPDDPGRIRAWLAAVVRNLTRNRVRDERRRVERLSAWTAGEAPSPEALAERLELHRVLAEAMASVAEPFRATLLLRYYEGLSSAEIARRLGTPSGTVRWRLKTGLGHLRSEMDRRHGGRRFVWLGPLAALGGGAPGSGPGIALGRGTSGTLRPALVAIGAAGLVSIAAFSLRSRPLPAEPRESASAQPGLSAAAEHAPRHPAAPAPFPRTPRPDPAPRFTPGLLEDPGPVEPPPADIPAWATVEGLPPRAIEGRVTSEGRPVQRAQVKLLSGMMPFADGYERRTTSDGAGRFGFPPQPATNWILTVEAAGLEPAMVYVELRETTAEPSAKHVQVTLEPCRVRVRGAVRDVNGGPIPGATVLAGLVGGVGGTAVRADDRGAYEICVPRKEGNPAPRVLQARAEGYGRAEVVLPFDDSARFDFRLERQAVIHGQVVVAGDGRPVARAKVSLARMGAPHQGDQAGPAVHEVLAGTDGRFEADGVAPGRYRVTVNHDDHVRREWTDQADLEVGPGEVARLVLETVPVISVEGRLLDRGRPLPDTPVHFWGPDPRTGRTVAAGWTATVGDGRFRVRLAPIAATNVTIYPPGRKRLTMTVPTALASPADRPIHLTLDLADAAD